jgi:wyosine [tRNA(Phe)-imidazoG37] synthetase (radical SAM superfamily)
LGLSLGVDLVPRKLCSYDCVFCQVGRTTDQRLQRAEHVPTARVLAELGAWFDGGGRADCVTLAGSGEPTLHSRFGEVLAAARRRGARCALLSNGSLMHLPDVRRDAGLADVVKVSLSAWDEASFRRINRPHPDLRFGALFEGLRCLGREVRGELWLEVFVVPGANDEPPQMARIAALAREIAPARVHLNTAVRPAPDPGVTAAPRARMDELASLFEPRAEVVAEFRGPEGGGACAGPADDEAVVAMLARHPCTAREAAASLGVPEADMAARLDRLAREGRVRAEGRVDAACYAAVSAGEAA